MSARQGSGETLLDLVQHYQETEWPDSCLLWTGTKIDPTTGYCRLSLNGQRRGVHVWAWVLSTGRLPKHTIDHLCRTRTCFNVRHLEDVTRAENGRRARLSEVVLGRKYIGNSRTTHCRAGHKWTRLTTHVSKDGQFRYCRPCRARNLRNFRKRRSDH